MERSGEGVVAHGGAVGCGTTLQAGRSQVQVPMVSLEFFTDITLPAALWPWLQLSFEQKWVPGIFPGGWQPYHLHVQTVLKSVILNLLEPSGPAIGLFRDCFTFTIIIKHLCRQWQKYSLYYRKEKAKRMRRSEYAAWTNDIRMLYKILVGEPQRTKLLWKPRCRWQDIFKMNLQLLLTNTLSKMLSGSLSKQQHRISKYF
jgi:hypothetical protein